MSRPSGRARAGRRGLIASLSLVLAFLGVVGGSMFSSPPAAAEVTDGEVTVDITQITPAVTRPGDDIVIRGTLANGTDEVIEAPRIQLVLQKHVPTSRTALESWLTGENSFNAAVLTVEYLDDLPDDAEVPFTLTLPAERSPFAGALWGPRGIEVRAVAEGTLAAERTALLWYPGEAQVSAPTELSVLVPFTPTAQEWTTSVAQDVPVARLAAERLGPVLTEMPDGVAWAIDAALLENQAAEGNATAETEGDPVTPEGDPVPPDDATSTTESAAAASTTESTGETDETESTGETDETDETGETASTAEEAGTPTAGETATNPGSSDQEESGSTGDPTFTEQLRNGVAQRDVIALGYADADQSVLTGPAGRDLTQAGRERTAELLAANGITVLDDVAWPANADLASVNALAQTNTRAVVLPAEAMPTTVPLNYTPSGRSHVETGSGDVLQAMLWDGPLSEVFGADLSALQIRQSVLAQTAVIAREQPADPRGLLAALDRNVGTDPEVMTALTETVTALESAPWVELSNLRSLLGRTDTREARATLPESSAGAHLDSVTVSALAQAWDEANAFAEITDDPARFRDEIAPRVLTGLSATLNTAPATRDRLVDEAFTAVAELSTRIGVEPASEVLLVSASGEIPITLESRLPVGATVDVRLAPQNPSLRAEETVTAHIPAGGATTVRVPVTAVANGNVDVSAEVLTASGERVLVTADPFQVRVRADWENIGTIVVAALLVVGLAIGLIRTIRKGQRRFEPAPRTAALVPDPDGDPAWDQETGQRPPSTGGRD